MTASRIKQILSSFRQIWIVELIYVSVWAMFMFSLSSPIRPGMIADINVDAYVRLERIYQWLDGGDWFAKILSRVGETDHLVLHWTRPLDLIVAPFALLLEPFFGLHDAVYIAGPLISLPIGIIIFALASRLPVICGENQPVMLERAAIFVFLIPHFLYILLPQNWPDHHGLLLLLFISSLLLVHKMVGGDRLAPKMTPWALGAVQALGLWISAEYMVAVLALNLGLGLLWVMGAEKNTAKMSLNTAVALLIGIAVALLLEFGTIFTGLALDRISTFSLLFAGGIIFIWLAASLSHSRLRRPMLRAVVGVVSAIFVAGVLLFIRPDAIHGPMADADKWFVGTWGGIFGDGFMFGTAGVYLIVGAGIISALWLALDNKKLRDVAILFMPAMLIYMALVVVDSQRWATYGEIVAVIFIIPVFAKMFRHMESKAGINWAMLRGLSLGGLIILASLDGIIRWVGLPLIIKQAYLPISGPMVGEKSAMDSSPDYELSEETFVAKRCNLNKAMKQLENYASGKELMVLAHPNATPAILFHSRHRVLSVPIHPDGAAVHKTYNLLNSTDAQFPPKSGADVVMICPGGVEKYVYSRDPASLHARLSRDVDVIGLALIGQIEQGYKIYRVTEPY